MDTPAHWRWRDEPVEPGKSAIFDLDGVLADAKGRQHYLDGGVRDWDGFFLAAGDDQLLDDTSQLLRLLGASLQVVLLTARPLFIRPATVDWLHRHDIPYDLLVMRPDFDRSPSSRFKRHALRGLRSSGFTPVIGFEDDVRNVEMLREEGVPCIYIHSGYYD
jgi:hypothetical protein